MSSLLAIFLVAFTTESKAAFERTSRFGTQMPDVPSAAFHRSWVGSSSSTSPVCRLVEINPTPNCTPPPRVGLELTWMSKGERREGMARLNSWSREHAGDGVLAVFVDTVADRAVVLAAYTRPVFLWLQSELEGVTTIPVEIRPPCRSREQLVRLREELEIFVHRSNPAPSVFAAEIDPRFGGIRVLLAYGEESLGAWLKAYFGDDVLVHYREPLPAWFKKKRRG